MRQWFMDDADARVNEANCYRAENNNYIIRSRTYSNCLSPTHHKYLVLLFDLYTVIKPTHDLLSNYNMNPPADAESINIKDLVRKNEVSTPNLSYNISLTGLPT